MSNQPDNVFKRFRIEPELLEKLDSLAKVRGEQKADIIADTLEWFLQQRQEGNLPPRYFASPNEAPYTGVRIKNSTEEKLQRQAKTDNQNPNRVLYTAIARYIEKDKS